MIPVIYRIIGVIRWSLLFQYEPLFAETKITFYELIANSQSA